MKNSKVILLTFLFCALFIPAHVLSAITTRCVFYNGTIITMDEENPTVEAVLIQDGTIEKVGSNEEILSLTDSGTDMVDLQGRTMLPGFIDAHSHWLNDLYEVDSIEAAMDLSISHGWTTTSNLFTEPWLIEDLLHIDSEGEIRGRVNLYLRLNWQDQRWTDWYKDFQPGEMLTPKIRIAGVKMFADGGVVAHTAALSEPYPDDPENYGQLFFTQEELDQLVSEAHSNGFQMAIHAIGDAAVEQVLDSYEAALGEDSNEDYRHRIEHCLVIRDDLIQRMSEKRIIASFQSHWVSADSQFLYIDSFGEERLDLVARWRDILDADVPAAASTDYPYCSFGSTAIQGIYNSVTRDGLFYGLENPDEFLAQRISVYEALRLMTIDAAYAIGQENVIGSITPGKYADFVVLSDNPLEVPPDDILDLSVWMTVIDGVIEFCRDDSDYYYIEASVEGPGSFLLSDLDTSFPQGRYSYPEGFVFNFNAVAGSPVSRSTTFSHWIVDGEIVEDSDELSIVMDADHKVTAVFLEEPEPEPEPQPEPEPEPEPQPEPEPEPQPEPEPEPQPEPEPEDDTTNRVITGFPIGSVIVGFYCIYLIRKQYQ